MIEKKSTGFRYLFYFIEIIVLFIIGATPSLLPELFGAKPCLLLCAALTAAVFEREIPAMLFGMLSGALIDLGYSTSVGVFTIGLTLLCFVIGFLSNNLIRASFLNFFICSVTVTAALYMLYYLLYFVASGMDNGGIYFVSHILPRMILTVVCSVPFYFLNKWIYHTLSDNES